MASPKFIALEWSAPELYGVLGELSKKYGWQLLYCVGHGMRERVAKDFPSAVYQDTHDARYGRPAEELASIPRAVMDQPTAEDLSFAEIMCLKQMDRMEMLGSFSLHDRLIHFHRLFGYWSAVFDRLRPDLLLMPTSPHVTYDYVAYLIARRRGIPIVLFEYVTLAGMFVAMDGFEDGVPRIMENYRRLRAAPQAGPVILSERMEGHLRALKGTYEDAMPEGLRMMRSLARAHEVRIAEARRHKIEYQKYQQRYGTRLRRFREELTRLAGQSLRTRISPRILKLAIREAFRQPPPFDVLVAPATDGYFRGKFFREAPAAISAEALEYRRRHIEAITRKYDELAIEPDLGKPYVYVALHLQPERATNPNGRIFDEQHVIVSLIASVLPPGWRIYVKEHPSVFMPHSATERGRWSTFYERIVEHPSASLVSRHSPSFSLIDNARAVATVTGTSSWEALVRGVPTLVFGEAWYKGCEGAYSIRTKDDCRDAFEKIAAGARPSAQQVRLFLRAAEEVSFVGYLSSDDAALAGIDEATNIARLAAAADECYRGTAKGKT